MVVLLQAHKVMQGTVKRTPYIMLYEGVCVWCWWVRKVDIPLVDSAKERVVLPDPRLFLSPLAFHDSRILPLTGLLRRPPLSRCEILSQGRLKCSFV